MDSHGAKEQAEVIRNLASLFQVVKIGEAIRSESLSIFPLSHPDGHTPSYALLEDMLATKEAEITELTQGGSVPELLVVNYSDKPILILEGDVLVGAKQNRTVNLTVLVAAKSKVVLPVSCVEQGRWNYVSKHFSVMHSASPSIRRSKSESVIFNKKRMGKAMSNQGQVWNEVDHLLKRRCIESKTQAYDDAIMESMEKIEETKKKIQLPEGATGYVLALGEGVVAMDLFGESAIAVRCWERLSASYMIEGLAYGKQTAEPPTHESVEGFIKNVGKSIQISEKSTGIGVELDVEGMDVTGVGLFYENRLVHLSAFAMEKKA